MLQSILKTSPLSALAQQLSGLTTGIPVIGKNIRPLYEPREFYEALLAHTRAAEKRICLASLYLGVGELEQQLLEVVAQSCASKPDLQVQLLFDHSRGTRLTNSSSLAMVSPLVASFPNQICANFFLLPQMYGFLEKRLPSRYNEGLGVSHLKAYVFDDTVILSGANLSHDYFTNRQDRYIEFGNCKALANHFTGLIETIANLSHKLEFDQNNQPVAVPRMEYADKQSAAQHTEAAIREFLDKSSTGDQNEHELGDYDTIIYPTLQLGTANIRQDQQVVAKVLQMCHTQDENQAQTDNESKSNNECHISKVVVASGYLNPTPTYADMMLNTHDDCLVDFILASPQANGFHSATGISAAVPLAYSLLEQELFERCIQEGKDHRVSFFEYEREGWTFHSKGLFLFLKGQDVPSVVTIGSPNLGIRSTDIDLEAQAVIVTENSDLRHILGQECRQLFENCQKVTPATFQQQNRMLMGMSFKQGYWIRFALPILASYF